MSPYRDPDKSLDELEYLERKRKNRVAFIWTVLIMTTCTVLVISIQAALDYREERLRVQYDAFQARQEACRNAGGNWTENYATDGRLVSGSCEYYGMDP